MKTYILTLLAVFFLSVASIAQNFTITVNGSVMLVTNNNMTPVSNQPVLIMIDSVGMGFTYENTVYTDESGYYEDIVSIPGFSGYGYVTTQTYDSCLGYNLYQGQMIAPNGFLQPMDFLLCNTITPECQAYFYYYQANPADPYTIAFENMSVGDYSQILWDFGDSTYSSEMYPVHTYAGPGTYYICLTISGTDCSNTYCEFIYIGGGSNGCENSFYYSYDEPFTLTFSGFLLNGQYAQYYSWDFGDGTYGTGQTVTHSYQPEGIGMYLVSLTTMVLDSLGMDTCVYTSYQEVWIQNQPGCNAYFSYYPDSLNMNTIQFFDMSNGPNGFPPDSWLWEFGDGTSSTLQNPMHTYADTGYYSVCLTITMNADSCTSTYCEDIYTGFPPPPGGCESFIIPLSMYGLTVDFEGYTVSPFETDYTWEFGDGVTGTGQYVSHTFPSPGMYDVTLQTIDANGCYFQTFTQIWLDSTNQGGCSAYFSYEQADSNTFTFNGVVYFNNGIIYPDSSIVYSWDFGDGTFGTGQTVTHYFQENPAGGYTVCLTATAVVPDGSACTAVYCEYINLVVPGFSIFGYVHLENNMAADQAVVHLMTMDTLWQGVVEVQSTTIDSGGFYNFPNISFYNSRVYYIQAELTEGSEYFGEYLPTYHVSALSWEQAEPILPLMNWTADVFMIPATTVNGGNGEISGTVTDLGTRGSMEDVEVVLLDAELNPLTYLRSDEQGMFAFSDLALGTYVIHAEMMGIHTIQAQVTLSEQDPSASVEVQVSGNEANIVFGIPEQPVLISKVSDIYPNPVKGEANIEITMSSPAAMSVSVIGITGQQVIADSYSLPAGTHRVEINTESLPEGIYLLQLVTENGESVSRKFIVR
jgi:PKD repeat protein